MTVTLDLDLNASGYIRGVDRAKRASGGFSKSIGGLVSGFAGAATAAVSAAAAVGAVTVKMLDVAASVEDSNDKFNTLFGEGAAGVEKWAQDWAGLVGVTDRAAKDLLSGTAAIVRGMGMSGEAAAEFSKEIVSVAGDLASFNDVSNERATGALQAALTGERERLKELGIVIHEADVQQRAMAMSGKENANSLTQQEKAAATLELIMERAGVAIGDAERTSDSLTKVMGRLRASFGNVMDIVAPMIANALRPMIDELAKLADWVRVNRETVQEWVIQGIAGVRAVADVWVNSLKAISGPIRAMVRLVQGDFAGAWEAAKDTMGFVPRSIGDVRDAMRDAQIQIADATAATVPYAAAMAGGGSGGAGGSDTSSVAGSTAVAEEQVEKFNEAMRSMPALTGVAAQKAAANAKAMSDRLSEEFNRVRSGVQGLTTDLLAIPETVLPKIAGAGGGNFFDSLFGSVQGKIKSVSDSISGFLTDTFGSKLGSAIVDGLGAVIAGPLGGVLANFGKQVLGSIGNVFKSILGFGKRLTADLSALTEKGYTVTEGFQRRYEEILNSSGQAAADNFAKTWAYQQRLAEQRRRDAEEAARLAQEQWQRETDAYNERMAQIEAAKAHNARAADAAAMYWSETHASMLAQADQYNANLEKQGRLAAQAARMAEAQWTNTYNAMLRASEAVNESIKRRQEAESRAARQRQIELQTEFRYLQAMGKVTEDPNDPNQPGGAPMSRIKLGAGQTDVYDDMGNRLGLLRRDQITQGGSGVRVYGQRGRELGTVSEDVYNQLEGVMDPLNEMLGELRMLNQQVAGGALGQAAARQTADRVTIGAPAAGFAR